MCGLPHDISSVIIELLGPDTLLDIPEHTRHVSRRSDDASIIDESTRTEVTRMSTEFSGNLDLTTWTTWTGTPDGVNGTDIVETTTSDEISAGCIGTSHDPRGSERDGVDLVCAVGVPDDKLTILRSRDEMPSVSRPVHGVDLGQVTFERTPDFECQTG